MALPSTTDAAPAAIAGRPIRIWTDRHFGYGLGDLFRPTLFARVDSIEECDLIVAPDVVFGIFAAGRIKEAVGRYTDMAQRHDRVLLILVVTDSDAPIVYLREKVVIFRIALTERRRLPNEFALPYLWSGRAESFEPKPRTGRPVIGFCGDTTIHPIRKRTIAQAEGDKRFDTEFRLRSAFWGGKPDDPVLAEEFFENIGASHFVLCDRGLGNFSMRFFQTMSCGRIPALVDTGMSLPRARSTPWSDVIVLGRDPADLMDRIHHVWTTRDMVEAQRRCRAFYDENLSMQGFSETLWAEIRRIVDDGDHRQRVFRSRPVARLAWRAFQRNA